MLHLDEFQKESIKYLKNGYSVIVSAPTGSGKTLIAEEIMKDSLREGKGVVYTSPIKALSNQKFRDFSHLFPDKVGIVTGDVNINPDKPLLIMTTEIFRNHLLEKSSQLKDKSWVIFDEIHYLDDVERGTVWEESLILLPPHIRFLALSATIPNIHSFGKWLKSIHSYPIKEIVEKRRPVPLRFYFQFQNDIYRSFKKVERKLSHFKYPRRNIPNRSVSLVSHLEKEDRLPVIYFSFSRKKCEDLAWEMEKFNFLEEEEKEKIRREIDILGEKLNLSGEKNFEDVKYLALKGIAFHHAGMLPSIKEVVERLFSEGFIKVIFTTETFALGVNMPARSVCFNDLLKRDRRGKRLLKVREFYQMAGRAGRRGKDEEGFVYSRINPHHIDISGLKKVIYGKPEPVRSQFNASYGTILNLYKEYKDGLLNIYSLSFHFYEHEKRGKRRGLDLLRSKLNLLKDLEYIKGDILTPKGEFSSKIFGYELTLGELFEGRFLEELSPVELSALISGIIFEGRRGIKIFPLSNSFEEIKRKVEDVVEYLRSEEKKCHVYPLTQKPHFQIAPAVVWWMKRGNFSEISKKVKIDDGELIRNFRMIVQVLRDILKCKISHKLKENIKESLRKIKKGIVDAEKELKEIASL